MYSQIDFGLIINYDIAAYTVSRKFPNVDNISTAELEDKLQSTSQNQPKILIIDSRKEVNSYL